MTRIFSMLSLSLVLTLPDLTPWKNPRKSGKLLMTVIIWWIRAGLFLIKHMSQISFPETTLKTYSIGLSTGYYGALRANQCPAFKVIYRTTGYLWTVKLSNARHRQFPGAPGSIQFKTACTKLANMTMSVPGQQIDLVCESFGLGWAGLG